MRFSLRLKLTLISFLLLLIPFVGFQFSERIRQDLVESRKETLLFSARAVATALEGRTGLLDQELFHSLNQSRDLYLFPLTNPMRLNGKEDDWLPQIGEADEFNGDHLLRSSGEYRYESLHFKHMLGIRDDFIYALFQVTDDTLVYRPPHSLGLDSGDHLQIGIEDQSGTLHRYTVSPSGSGWVNGYSLPEDPELRFPITLERRIQGVWLETSQGYNLELRLPRELVGDRFGFAIADVDNRITGEIETLIGTVNPKSSEELGWLLSPSSEIEQILKDFDREQSRILIVDSNQRVRASYGSLQSTAADNKQVSGGFKAFSTVVYGILKPLYTLFTTPFTSDFTIPLALPGTLDISGVQEGLEGKSRITSYTIADGKVEIMAAISPLWEGETVIGAVVVEQSTNSILAMQNSVIEDSLSFTILAFTIAATSLLLYASRISWRIRRLRDQSAAAINDDGTVSNSLQPTTSRDELGDLSRTLHAILRQLGDQSLYRETMADNLEHEMRTPLAGISASIKNVKHELENPTPQISKYLDWALTDVIRLEELLSNIRDATNLQQALDMDSHEYFNLAEAMQLWLEHGWQPAFADCTITYKRPCNEILLFGDPGRIRQLLDKLIENAVSFHNKQTVIEVGLSVSRQQITLFVQNEGPTIPDEIKGQIFNSMVSQRQDQDSRPHLGLGLYIVRTIALHHNGMVNVENLQGSKSGVKFSVILPLGDKHEIRLMQ